VYNWRLCSSVSEIRRFFFVVELDLTCDHLTAGSQAKSTSPRESGHFFTFVFAPRHQARRYVTPFLGKTVLFNFVFPRRYVAKMIEKSVFLDKITGKKGGLFSPMIFFGKTVFPKKSHT